jgi:hypothetical protein
MRTFKVGGMTSHEFTYLSFRLHDTRAETSALEADIALLHEFCFDIVDDFRWLQRL